VIDLREEITVGQRVARYVIEGLGKTGGWSEIARGSTIGYRRLHRVEAIEINALRVRVEETVDVPLPVAIRAWS
jgi:alpha-L-fucosidase